MVSFLQFSYTKMVSNTKILNLVILFLLFGSFKIVFTEENNWRPNVIFLMGGQSNMDGRGKVAELPKEFLVGPKNVRIWNKTVWVEIKPEGLFGPEVAFAAEIAKLWPNQLIGIVKFASGGTNMTQWGAPKFSKEKDAGNTLYYSWMAMYDAAHKTVPNAPVVGAFWMQGESDASKKELADEYKNNLKKLIEAIRRDVGIKNLPFINGKIQSKNFEFVSTVWKAQEEIAKEIPLTSLVNTDAMDNDQLHFSSKGLLDLGKAFAEEFLKVSKKVKTKTVKK